MKEFTFKCNKYGSEKIEISVLTCDKRGSYELMAECKFCGNKENLKQH